MTEMRKKLAHLIHDESGQTAVEYMLILAVIVGVIFALGGTFKARFNSLVNTVFEKIERQVKSL